MHYSINRSRQHGTALVISMIILLVTTMIILQGARSANLDLLVGNNSQSAAEALMLAEDSAIVGETMIATRYKGAPEIDYGDTISDGVFLAGQINVNSVNWDSMLYPPESDRAQDPYTETVTGPDGETTETEHEGSAERQFYAEYLGPAFATGGSVSVGAGVASDTRYMYRISGRGVSTRGGARVIQTIYATAE